MKKVEPVFPAGLALGQAFCNRLKERADLKNSILGNEHVVMVSPRRYGKTSLITQVIHENNIPSCAIDFLPATNQQYVKAAILEGVGKLLPLILPKQKALMKKSLGLFIKFNPKISVSLENLGFSIEFSSPESPAESIVDSLIALDQVAQKMNKRLVFLMDEFQQIDSLSDHHMIEASIRHAVERSKNVTYVFSGSERHTLEQMFNGKNRPLYHLCKLIKIERIHPEEFVKFIQNAAKLKWSKDLDQEAMEAILKLTECHTYYVNYLCRQLWKLDSLPSEQDVITEWERYVQDQRPRITDEIGRLTANQRALLAALAFEPIKEIFSYHFSTKTGLAPASIKRVLDTLETNNMLYKDRQGVFHVLDPAIASYFKSVKTLRV